MGINVNPITAFASILGKDLDDFSNSNVDKATIEDGVQVINMIANNNGFTPNAFYVQKGIPVKWIINGESLTSCNNAIVAQAISKNEVKIKKGENILEFTPGDEDINFSCWMGMIRGVIKVVDDIASVDTSKNDPSLPPPATSPSCCAVPLDKNGDSAQSQPSNPSIYGDDITQIPTSLLVNKAIFDGEYQESNFKGIGYELQPLVIVTGNSTKTKLTFNLSDFDNAEGKYLIVDIQTGDLISTFEAKKGINEIEFNPGRSGEFAIYNFDGVLGIIEVVDYFESANLELIRRKYLE